jgi:hypothetical protein
VPFGVGTDGEVEGDCVLWLDLINCPKTVSRRLNVSGTFGHRRYRWAIRSRRSRRSRRFHVPYDSSCAVFWGVGPKGLGNLAQALAWVALFLRASPVRAPDNARAIPIDRTQIQMTISSAPAGLVAFIVTPPRLKPGSGVWPFFRRRHERLRARFFFKRRL